ncbi:MAG: hypothetical protein JW991_04560 [Candidatus Pacebacteria bacterium]|nr:hypothetical protein [Candidatus Paceibacterota bacterium]
MVDVVQIILVMVVTTVTILLVILGIQVFNILKEFRGTINKVNKMLDDFGTVSESIAKPIASAADILTGATGITGLLGWLFNRKKKDGGIEDE